MRDGAEPAAVVHVLAHVGVSEQRPVQDVLDLRLRVRVVDDLLAVPQGRRLVPHVESRAVQRDEVHADDLAPRVLDALHLRLAEALEDEGAELRRVRDVVLHVRRVEDLRGHVEAAESLLRQRDRSWCAGAFPRGRGSRRPRRRRGRARSDSR